MSQAKFLLIRFLMPSMTIAFWLLLAAACAPAPPAVSRDSVPPPAYTEAFAQSSGSSSYVIVPTVQELVNHASVIVIGHVTRTDYSFNAFRGGDGDTEPDPRYFAVAQVYQVAVGRYLKGEGEDTIYIAQLESFDIRHGLTPSPDEIRKAQRGYDYIRFEPQIRYLLFLKPLPRISEGGVPDDQIYAGVEDPWCFDVSDPDRVVAISTVWDSTESFRPRPLADFIRQIEHPEMDVLPTPTFDVRLLTQPAGLRPYPGPLSTALPSYP